MICSSLRHHRHKFLIIYSPILSFIIIIITIIYSSQKLKVNVFSYVVCIDIIDDFIYGSIITHSILCHRMLKLVPCDVSYLRRRKI